MCITETPFIQWISQFIDYNWLLDVFVYDQINTVECGIFIVVLWLRHRSIAHTVELKWAEWIDNIYTRTFSHPPKDTQQSVCLKLLIRHSLISLGYALIEISIWGYYFHHIQAGGEAIIQLIALYVLVQIVPVGIMLKYIFNDDPVFISAREYGPFEQHRLKCRKLHSPSKPWYLNYKQK